MDLSKLDVKQLRELCGKGAVSTGGTKEELIARLERILHRLPTEALKEEQD